MLLCEQKTEKCSSASDFHLLNQYLIFSTLLISSHCQVMTNSIANRYRCVCLFSAFIFSSSNWRQRHVASAQKNMCLLPWQQWLKHQPIWMVRRWGFLSVQHRHSRVYSGETSRNTSAPMTRKLFMPSLRAAATGPFLRTALNGTWKYGLQFPGTQ